MIEIKRCNYITGDNSSVSYGLSRIIEFLESSGRNPLLIYNDSNLKYFVDISKIKFSNYSEFQDIIDNRSNLFRVDLLIVDLWYVQRLDKIMSYKSLLDKLNIDHFIISKSFHYKSSDDVGIYELSKMPDDEIGFKNQNNYKVTEKIAGWSSNLNDLAISWKRDKKIDDIIHSKNK
jgi:hypothetical protein